MKFGVSTLSRGIYTSRDAYMAVAQAAERAGFDFMSVNDHLIVPGKLGSAYPYTQGGVWSAAEHGHCFDVITALAFLAGCTSRLRLLTSVMVVPHRPVIATAKMLATLDVLSGGRLILGAGAGWMKEEFALLGAPFEDRGRATDEYLEAFKVLWTQERPSYSGKHVNFSDVIFAPQPIQKPHPPIWIGGESPAALRRTAKLGDAWYPGNNNQQKPMDTPARLKTGIADLHRVAEQSGRNPKSIDICLIVQNPFDWAEQKTQDGSARRMFTGTSANMAEDAGALAAVGVSHVALRLGGETVAESVARIERFRRRRHREGVVAGRVGLAQPDRQPGCAPAEPRATQFSSLREHLGRHAVVHIGGRRRDIAVAQVGAAFAALVIVGLESCELVGFERRALLLRDAVKPCVVLAENRPLHRTVRAAKWFEAKFLLHVGWDL